MVNWDSAIGKTESLVGWFAEFSQNEDLLVGLPLFGLGVDFSTVRFSM